MITQLMSKTEDLMKKTIEKFKTELHSIRTGRASISLVESIEVECYNSKMVLNQVANFNIVEGRIIEIRPWDVSIIGNIEKAILKSSLGLTPMNDGKMIKLTVPSLTDERRQELVKKVNKIAETYRISIRNERRAAIEELKQALKDKKISEDEEKKTEAHFQKLTENYIKKIDELLALKVKEISE
ncbi:MAG: ribosome recycling factor [Endomicrobiia bacterium]